MTTCESNIQTIPAGATAIFNKLSNLKNLQYLQDKIPAGAGISDLQCDEDSLSFRVNPVGQVALRIVERDCPKTIKFASENSPLAFNLWIQLVEKGENDTRLKVTLKAEIPMMFKMMLGSKLNDFVNRFAGVLAAIDYTE